MVSSGHSVVSISITSLALLISTAIMALKPPKPQADIKICSSEIKKVAEGGEEEEQKGYSNDPSSSSEDYSDIDSTAQGSDDGSISDDEESLFEICLLPYNGNFVGHEKESSKDCLMEFLTDMNEEDNMIQIDISMGSIKCSGF
nr:DBF4-type zinc finger-containing protein [Ipomoea batatas]GMD32029.1 DBF4-type zinc finger-containing protein [Ipomoea batatas]GMD38568.1 DBF4-type zinc finger-containing protein [Ipomoea batatas]